VDISALIESGRSGKMKIDNQTKNTMKYEKGSFITVPNSKTLKGADPQAQCLFMWICHHANQSGECFPSRKLLSDETGMSVPSVQRATARLEELGIIRKTTRKEGGRNMTNIYEILIGEEPVKDDEPTLPAVVKKDVEIKTGEFIKEVEQACSGVTLNDGQKNEIKKFISYWTEPNKSRTKIKWEMQSTWDLKRRLGTWFRNAVRFNGGSQSNKYKVQDA
jgi:DNA-binding transcriptional ArsR family regulator